MTTIYLPQRFSSSQPIHSNPPLALIEFSTPSLRGLSPNSLTTIQIFTQSPAPSVSPKQKGMLSSMTTLTYFLSLEEDTARNTRRTFSHTHVCDFVYVKRQGVSNFLWTRPIIFSDCGSFFFCFGFSLKFSLKFNSQGGIFVMLFFHVAKQTS